MKMFSLVFVFVIYILGVELSATIVNTKHNLSTSSTKTIKAQTETEICIFCHIPHSAMPDGKPLWNRSMPSSSYTMYNSDYLKRMNYPDVALDLGSLNNTPGALSRQCLSCHDGTVAIGAVHVLHGTIDSTIAMNNVNGDGTILSTAAGFIGTDLTMHHPVGIEYDSTVTMSFDSGGKTIELKATPDAPVQLFTYGGKDYVECSSCHDPHKDNDKFLHVDSGTNFAQNVSITCTSCHEKTDWSGSIHETPPADALYTNADLLTKYGTNKMSDLGCANCHTPHNGEGVPYLTRKSLGNTCFTGATADGTGAACHGVGGYKDIESILSRNVAHPVLAEDNILGNAHTNLDTIYGTGLVDPDGGKGIAWGDNKHAVCMDCHNQHKAKAGTHVTDGTWYGTTGILPTNLVSNVLLGVSGVEPTIWPDEWTQPMSFTTLESSTKEYQICFKCHSYWGIGGATNGVNNNGYETQDLATRIPLTDVAWEMNKKNKSGHPVVLPNSPLGRPGSFEPQELGPEQLLEPWKSFRGSATMYCSDCHGADNEIGGDPKGPHGSSLPFILKGTNQFWPAKEGGSVLYDLNDIQSGTDGGVFCKNCHDILIPHDKWRNQMANKGYACVECHVSIPHGSTVSRLVGYANFPAPYNYGGNSLKLDGWKKNGIYNPNDAGTAANAYSLACGNGGAGGGDGNGCHMNNYGGYDDGVMP